jgi:hypothetical protein
MTETTYYVPVLGEDTEQLEAFNVVGDCQSPVICDGDVAVVDRVRTPAPGNYVIYGGGVWRYQVDDHGQPYLTNNYGDCKLVDITLLWGVVVAVTKKVDMTVEPTFFRILKNVGVPAGDGMTVPVERPVCPLRECRKVGHVVDEREVCLSCSLPACVYDGQPEVVIRKRRRKRGK